MSDPVNSSDEAVEALTRLIADHPMWIADNGRALDYLPEREAKISDFLDEARSIFAAFAAAVRAEAVADERRRIEGSPYEIARVIARVFMLAANPNVPKSNLTTVAPNQTDCDAADAVIALLAAGSVPVATPEPTGQSRCDLILCSHCLLTPAEIDATDHHSGGWCPGPVATPPARSVGDVLAADITGDLPPDRVVNTRPAPSQPVTCAHWKTESHVIDLARPHKVWCPGPVSVPKESSE